MSAPAPAEPLSHWPDGFLGRVEALAVIQTLNAGLLGGRSATLTLEKWCADHKMAAEPKVIARLVTGVEKPPSDEQRRRLRVAADEPVRYRRVQLSCGGHVLSEADNWYVPARLAPEMNRLLETTDTPFGKVVSALNPVRRTFAVETLWEPLPRGWEQERAIAREELRGPLDAPRELFTHRAILYADDRQPISEVKETYTNEILGFDAVGAGTR
ncbi:MAG: hypothetical protein C3F11_10790 [Methylocystaceae bacterium]|nr:MAG: hypothetical protein C3F11_10790 [Methylocystaceae bacterium]